MPYVFLLIGLALAISAIEGTYNALGTQLKQDLTGPKSFITWALAIGMVGALGYIEDIRPVTNRLLWLILIVLFLANGGAWQNLITAWKQGPIAPPKQPAVGTGSGAGSAPQGSGNSSTVIKPGGVGISGVNELPDLPNLSNWQNDLGTLEKLAPLAALAM